MGDPIIIDYIPFEPHQADFHVARHRVKAAIAGARGGKTKAGIFETIDNAGHQPGFHPDDIKRGEPYTIVIGAPTFPMTQRVLIPQFLASVPRQVVIGKYHETKRLLRIQGRRGETHIYFISGKSPESWQGQKLYGVWLDEFPGMKEQMYDEAKTRLFDRKGWMILTGTPQGPNWAKKRILDTFKKKEDPDLFFKNWKTIDNPYIDKDEVAKKKREMPPKYFRRTFEASFDVFEGQIYDEFLEQVHCRPRAAYTFVLPDRKTRVGNGGTIVRLERVVAGMDWGFAVGHPGALLIGGHENGRWWILEESVAEGVLVKADSGDSWINRARTLFSKWQVEAVYCDTENPEAIAQFRKAELPARDAVKDVTPGIETVAKYVHVQEGESAEPCMILMDDLRRTIDEILYYHWLEGREKPDKVADHTMDSIRYMLHTFEKRGTFRRETDKDLRRRRVHA